MKKVVSLFMFLMLVLSNLFACANSQKQVSNVPETVADIDVNVNTTETSKFVQTKFYVGFDAEYPPFGYLSEDGKTYVGFDLDLAQEVCKRIGLEYVPQPIDWDSKDMELNSDSIDCIWSGFTINGRENDYEWTVPYVDNSIVLVVNADSGIKTKADLAGKVVAVQAASSGLDALTNEENTENVELVKTFKSLEQTADYNTAFMNLETGMVDCVVVDIGVAKYQLGQKDGKFVQLDETVSSEKYGVGFKKGNTELRDKVENALFDMWKDGTFMKIADKYSDFAISDTVCIGDYVK